MKTQMKSLRLLVGVRKRQGERLEAAVTQARRDLAQREEAVRRAQDEHAACAADIAQAHMDLDTLMGAAFTPAGVRAHGFRVEGLLQAEARAQREVGERRKTDDQQAATLGLAQAAKRRNDQRVARFQERIDDLLRAHDAAQEGRAEEETEEASIARHVARSRAAREAALEADRHG